MAIFYNARWQTWHLLPQVAYRFYYHLEFEPVVERAMLKEYHLDLLSWQDEEHQIYFADIRTYFSAGAEFDFVPQIYAIRVLHEDYWFVKPYPASSMNFKVSAKFRGFWQLSDKKM